MEYDSVTKDRLPWKPDCTLPGIARANGGTLQWRNCAGMSPMSQGVGSALWAIADDYDELSAQRSDVAIRPFLSILGSHTILNIKSVPARRRKMGFFRALALRPGGLEGHAAGTLLWRISAGAGPKSLCRIEEREALQRFLPFLD